MVDKIRQRLQGEGGFTLLEVMGALSILAVGFLALAGTASTAARMLVESRQRQAASETASRQIEHLRNVPYDQVALTSAPAHSADPEHPDYYVSTDGSGYDHDANATFETIVVDAAGQVPHSEVFTVGSTVVTTFQYVTWVDDPAITGSQDYKRLVIEATYDGNPGRPGSVRASALVTPGTVTVPGTGTGATQGTSGTPTPTPTPTPSGSCSGDTTAPSGTFTILSGTGAASGFTASTAVTVQLSPSDGCEPIRVELSNDGSTWGTQFTYDATNPTVTWSVPSGDGLKQVWARFRDGNENARVDGPKSITLDQTLPTTPASLNRSLSCTGNNRTASLTWGASTDTNLVAYRVYRSIDNGPFIVATTVNTMSASNTHLKTLDSVRFKIAAYDKAGNESASSNQVTLAKNQCS